MRTIGQRNLLSDISRTGDDLRRSEGQCGCAERLEGPDHWGHWRATQAVSFLRSSTSVVAGKSPASGEEGMLSDAMLEGTRCVRKTGAHHYGKSQIELGWQVGSPPISSLSNRLL